MEGGYTTERTNSMRIKRKHYQLDQDSIVVKKIFKANSNEFNLIDCRVSEQTADMSIISADENIDMYDEAIEKRMVEEYNREMNRKLFLQMFGP
jgi:hypothetical protein